MEKVTGKKVFENFLWRFFERCGAQLVAFVVTIVIARILDPDAYGTVALISVFTSVMSVFVDCGLGNSLIQKKDADDIDFSTVFYANVAFCSTLYIILFFAAPFIAKFYDDMTLVPLIRVSGLILVISGLKNIQHAYISKNMIFKKFFFATLLGTVISGVVGVGMAYAGYGAWALIAQRLTNNFVDTVFLWITVKWRPKKTFSFERLKGLFSFGWKLLVSSILNSFYENIWQLVIGKKYTSEDLAFYNRGKQFPDLIITNINSSMDSVLLPALSSEQDNRVRVKVMAKRVIATNIYIIAPLLMGLAAIAEPLIRLLLTEKWLPSVPYIRIFCVTLMFYPIHTTNLNAIKAMGRSDLFLKLEIIKSIVGLIILFVAMPWGVKAIAYSTLVSSVICQMINSWPNKKLISYSYIEQMRDILPEVFLAMLMGICVYFIGYIPLPTFAVITIQLLVGMLLYITFSALFKLEAFQYILNFVKRMMKEERK